MNQYDDFRIILQKIGFFELREVLGFSVQVSGTIFPGPRLKFRQLGVPFSIRPAVFLAGGCSDT